MQGMKLLLPEHSREFCNLGVRAGRATIAAGIKNKKGVVPIAEIVIIDVGLVRLGVSVSVVCVESAGGIEEGNLGIIIFSREVVDYLMVIVDAEDG
jgi:hypothetical protein